MLDVRRGFVGRVQRRPDRSGRHRIDAYALADQVAGQRLGEGVDGALGGRVVEQLRTAFETGDGTATAGVDYTANSSFGEAMLESESSTTITIQTTATGPGSNTAFTVTVRESA